MSAPAEGGCEGLAGGISSGKTYVPRKAFANDLGNRRVAVAVPAPWPISCLDRDGSQPRKVSVAIVADDITRHFDSSDSEHANITETLLKKPF